LQQLYNNYLHFLGQNVSMRRNNAKHLSAAEKLIVAATFLINAFGFNLPPSQPQEVSAQAISACLNRVHIPQEDLH